jgi:hypothetical protein
MKIPPSPDAPVHSIALRKTLVIAFAALLLVGFIPVLLQYKGLIDVENFGVHQSYRYVGGFAASLIGLIALSSSGAALAAACTSAGKAILRSAQMQREVQMIGICPG